MTSHISKKPPTPPSVPVGSIIMFGHGPHMLVEYLNSKGTLINLESGNRWRDLPIKIFDVGGERYARLESVRHYVGADLEVLPHFTINTKEI